jgi:hypothetical protein
VHLEDALALAFVSRILGAGTHGINPRDGFNGDASFPPVSTRGLHFGKKRIRCAAESFAGERETVAHRDGPSHDGRSETAVVHDSQGQGRAVQVGAGSGLGASRRDPHTATEWRRTETMQQRLRLPKSLPIYADMARCTRPSTAMQLIFATISGRWRASSASAFRSPHPY